MGEGDGAMVAEGDGPPKEGTVRVRVGGKEVRAVPCRAVLPEQLTRIHT